MINKYGHHKARCQTSLWRPAEALLWDSGWMGLGANISASQPASQPSTWSLPRDIKHCRSKTSLGLESCSCLALGNDGWWEGDVGLEAGGMPMTYSRFRSYSCGNTVIISPLLLNSVIVSYISRARGQEIFQFINRSTLRKGDYCMAYILTSFLAWKMSFVLRTSSVPDHSGLTEHSEPTRCLHINMPPRFTVSMEKGMQRDKVSHRLQ